uniref:Large ribosomal subunit protein uL23c n=1 Tax=Digenea simplex TaxID=945030 RepID=A0A1Z1MUD4_DIGSM|nr:ribosomal protein L23 [Digenea simplex]ARW69576.1 ribosomal protein L23 [Digenea simplex]
MVKRKNLQKIIDIIKYPIITDKTTRNIENNVYSFKVDKKSSKVEIKQAIEYIFDVKVKKVNTINYIRKTKTVGKFRGYKSGYKKAIVKLDQEYTINLFENT